jgi:hypothetical protein
MFLIVTTLIGAGIGFLVRRQAIERAAEAELVARGLTVSFNPWGDGQDGRYRSYDQQTERNVAGDRR